MSVKEINEDDKRKLFLTIQSISCERVQNYTQGQIAKYLGVSRKTMIEFEKGNIYDIRLLFAYASINGHEINFNLK